MRKNTARLAAYVFCITALILPWVAVPSPSAAAQNEAAGKTYLPFILVRGPNIYTYALPLAYGAPYQCEVIAQTPADGSYMQAGLPFNVSWTLRNTSYDTWKAGTAAVRYFEGVMPDANETLFPLPYDVSPQHMLQITVPFTAPVASGTYRSHWGLTMEQTTICRFSVEFRVP